VKRIGLFLETEPSAGGIYQYSQAMLEALAALPTADYEVVVACAHEAWREVLARSPLSIAWLRHGRLGLRLATLFKGMLMPGGLARWLSSLVNPLYREMKRFDCDLWIYPAPDALAYQLRLPALITIHDLMHRYEGQFPEVGGGYRYYVRDHRFGSMVRWARGVLVDSQVGRQQVVESYGVDPAKVHALPYIPPRSILEAKDDPAAVAKYNLPQKFFFYPAQLWAHKNHKRLISAAASLKDVLPDIHLVFTGRGRHSYDDIMAHAAQTGMTANITVLGYVPEADLPALYRAARALVMPTFLGPTNIPPLEAFACGCPVAISGIYGMPEQLGDAALYFDPKSVPDIARTLDRLWRDDGLCEILRAKGARHAAAWGQPQFNARFAQIVGQVTADAQRG
jgi:glycosyltransferase involved in cell wall biosynthesis